MGWKEFLGPRGKDEYDNQAIEIYNDWVHMINSDAEREVFVKKGLDPDFMNEFCFYPIEHWDRLIQWAKNYYAEQEAPNYRDRLKRATLLRIGVDPEFMESVNDPCYPNVWMQGNALTGAYHEAVNDWMDNSPTFDEVSFGLNSFSNAIVIRNDKDFEVQENARTMTFIPSDQADFLDEEQYEDEEDDLIDGEDDLPDEEEMIPLDEFLARMDAEYEEEMRSRGNPVDGYEITAPNGETHIYPIPNPSFIAQLKAGINLPGCDRYGNKLHPNDPKVRYEQEKREQEERDLEMQMLEEEDEYNNACEMAFIHGGDPEDYL